MASTNLGSSTQRIRVTPRLPHDKDAEPAASTIMYWSRAPVYGTCPTRTMRGHTVTLVDSTAWVFGGCDDKETSRDIYCFDVETMQWTHPETVGDIPSPSRAHTATLVDRKIYIFGGGQSANYSSNVYVLDTTTRRWTRPEIQGEIPAPRRAHTAVYYAGKIWVFGGGNGMMALNDVWALNVAKMEWEKIKPRGMLDRFGREVLPSPRGYHTANLVGNMMIVVGGSDGKDCFAEVWLLNLDTLEWTIMELPESHKRLSHTSTQVGSYLFIQGGHNGAEYINDMKFFNLVNLQYEYRQVLGKPPTPRGYHVSILADSRLFFFGGYNGANAYDDVHIVDLAGAAYLPQVTSFTIEV
ncbi:galactose oxidase [Dendrothele bispora CBS 962.96]|uniref:Galactose oxidase n=1 Tax=Dendrothele bispora (strain CBS 962.96) TaxID=1314807 RepID=A0A4S8MJ78_DENBC|nr:galactose oxidase [Dendrothele bispora CBS 962.96]